MLAVLAPAAATLGVTFILCFTASRAWRGWLELKRLQFTSHQTVLDTAGDDVAIRIELAAVRERLRKLEAIANGVDL